MKRRKENPSLHHLVGQQQTFALETTVNASNKRDSSPVAINQLREYLQVSTSGQVRSGQEKVVAPALNRQRHYS